MAATEPGPAPNEYTLGRLLKTYALVVAAAAIVVIVSLVALFALIYAVFVLGPGPRAATIETVVDDLRLAPGWTVEDTIVEETGYIGGCSRFLNIAHRCPSVTRYYLVDAEFPDAVSAAHGMVEGTGATIDWEAYPDCGKFSSSSRVCFLYGNVGDVRLGVNVYLPGEGDDGWRIARPDRVMVRLIATFDDPLRMPTPGASP
jgi:hypothetical protein